MLAVMRSCAACSSRVSWRHRARKTIGAVGVSPGVIPGRPCGTACEGYIPTMMMFMARRMNVRTLVLVIALVEET
jgi:hypothetical protein